jgi:hypothetical protein
MTSENFEKALEVLREGSLEGPESGHLTWQRIVASRRRRQRSSPLLLLVVFLCFAAGAAASIHELSPVLHWRSAPVAPAAVAPALLTRTETVEVPPPPSTPAAVEPLPLARAPKAAWHAPSARPRLAERPAEVQTEARSEGPASELPASDPQDALFDEVRRTQARVRPEEALAGWERYLAAYPHGRFAPEARFGRAVALAKLGRNAEASQAFLWFAEGTEDGYRAAESVRWMYAIAEDQ